MPKFCWLLILATVSGAALTIAGFYFILKHRSTRVQDNDRGEESNSRFERPTIETPYYLVSGLSVFVGVSLFFMGFHFMSSDCRKEPNSPNINVTLESNTNTNSNTNSNTNASLTQLEERMDRGIQEDRYEVRRYYNNEVVKGKFGKYYTIDLRDADSKELILFNLAKYTRDEYEPAFRASMYRLKDDIIIRLASGKVNYNLYVRGSADILGNRKPYIGTLIGGDSRKVTYLLTNPDDPNQYIQDSRTETVPKAFANNHLPNLRAAYLQEKLQAMELTSLILDGSVTGREDDKDRSALILLYLPK